MGGALNLIKNDETAERIKGAGGVIGQTGGVQVVFEVEPVDIGAAFEMAGERGFAALTWAEEQDNRGLQEAFLDTAQQVLTGIYHAIAV